MTHYVRSRSAVHAASGRSGTIGFTVVLAVVAVLLAAPLDAAGQSDPFASEIHTAIPMAIPAGDIWRMVILEDGVVFPPGYVGRQHR